MCRVFMIADLHLGHDNVLKFCKEYRKGSTVDEMNEWLVQQWNSVVAPRDLVWVLGDVAWSKKSLKLIGIMNGRKKLCLGNHDNYDIAFYKSYFDEVVAYKKYKGFWLSHMPIDSYDINNARVRGSIHGHLHQNTTGKAFHHNVCVEHCNGTPVLFTDIVKQHEERICQT